MKTIVTKTKKTKTRTTTKVKTTEVTTRTVTYCQRSGPTLAAWRAAVEDLAGTPLNPANLGPLSHELIPGTNSLEWDKIGGTSFEDLGKAFVSVDTGDWKEEWFVENPDFFLKFPKDAVARIEFESVADDSSVYPVTTDTRKALLQFKYLALPSLSAVQSLPAPPTSNYETDSISVFGQASLSAVPKQTGWLFREINTEKSPAVITEHWVLSNEYKPPANDYKRIILDRKGTYTDVTHLEDFLTKMINESGNGAGWLYVQVSFSLVDP